MNLSIGILAATASVFFLGVHPAQAASKRDSELNNVDIITVVGKAQDVGDIAGSVTFIPSAELELQKYTDVNRILRKVTGVNLQEEDGYGLRPNIGIRGTGSDRSSKVLIMEDGVLLSPAPYSAPSAYYFPFVGRTSAVEVTKGPGTIKYGPQTTGGVIHFFSTPIPEEKSARITALVSDLDRSSVHAWAGNTYEIENLPFDVGFLLETLQDNADGFKDLNTGDTGFSIGDYVAKLGFYSNKDAAYEQSLVFKYQHSEEEADETYVGLTQAQFDQNPYQRLNASQLDVINTDHDTYQATHNIKLSDNLQLTTIAYRTEFARNWEKLDRFDNSLLSGLSACNSLNGILSDPVTCSLELEVLVGAPGYVSPDDVLGIRQNKRSYYGQGIQSAIAYEFTAGSWDHSFTTSIRLHKDEVDRFQEQDQYKIDNTIVVKTTDNAPGTQANRLSRSEAISVYVADTLSQGPLRITAGLRLESVDSMQQRWQAPARIEANLSSERSNSYDEVLPALSVLFEVSDNLSLLAGAHKGFSPAPVSSRGGTNPEESIAYELGGRFSNSQIDIEAIGFFNDYSNLLAECTNSSGGSECVIGDGENAGEANVWGLELTAGADLGEQLAPRSEVAIPVSLAYTYTDTELLNSVSSDILGNITAGDEIPYVPNNQLTISAGLIGSNWGIDTVVNYVDETRDVPGQGSIAAAELIDGRTIIDLAAYYDVKEGVRLKIKADNVFDEVYRVARRPYGLRPGKPREVFVGISMDL